MAVHFHFQHPEFKLPNKGRIQKWLANLAANKGHNRISLHYIFTTDEEILRINHQYLQHDYYTDIITFDQREGNEKILRADIFISIDTVFSNHKKYKTEFQQELLRVMAHGLLHLCGYHDKKVSDQQIMRREEEKALQLYAAQG